jgi:putative OPT family oligopeptide transporter
LLKKGQLGLEMSGALFGVGFILGPRIGAIMVGGGLLSSLVLIPAIAAWGEGRAVPFYPETVKTIAQMSPNELWSRYVRYIGAGAVATAGLITLIRSIPTMVASFRMGAAQLADQLQRRAPSGGGPRTDRDLSFGVIGVGSAAVILVLVVFPQIFATLPGAGPRAIAAVLVTIAAFFFVTVSSRIVGLVGVTSNPTSGMTIGTLLMTTAVFLALGWTGDQGKAAALTVGCVVAIAASIAGDMSQDLKTGFLVGATPRLQQIGQVLGVLTSAAFVCLAVILLDRAYGFGSTALPAPQATLMKLVIEGVLQSSLPWALVGIGAGIALLAELLRIPSLPFAVGVYLPVTTMIPIFLGGLLRLAAEKRAPHSAGASARRERGILFGSGLVGGEGLLGVAIAAVAFASGAAPSGIGPGWAGRAAPLVALTAFALLALLFWRLVCSASAAVSSRKGAG